MRIAMFLKYEIAKGIYAGDRIEAFVFDISRGKILSFQRECLSVGNINYISLWLLDKGIQEVYVRQADSKSKIYFSRMGVSLKSYDELENKELFLKYLDPP